MVLSHERLAREIAEKSVQLRDDFLSVAAHELKTPLTAFKMQIEFLKKLLSEESCSNLPKIETILNAIETSKDQLEQFLRLLDDLLNAQHISSGKLFIERENVDLSFIIRNVIESYQEIIRKDGCSIKLATDSSINGFWDSARVRQVVSNLVSNAIKYGAGAPIEVETSRVGSSARIMVRDHGIGIAKEEQGKLFRRFERVTSAKGIQGFGLGLYITKQIVEAHGGKIWVESEPSKGSTFYVELPLEK